MVQVSVKADGQAFEHFWSVCAGAGRANEGLRATWLDHLGVVINECGFKYLRFHGLFHDDMFICRRQGDGWLYNWQYVDDLFDRMLDMGVRPFVEFGFCPRDMARETETIFWWKAHGAPPKRLEDWSSLVDATVRHWVERYGIDEVRKWYFEVWNEPNLSMFFRGTRSEYYELYRTTALAVKRVDAELRVGGPATSNFVCCDRFDGETEDLSVPCQLHTADDTTNLPWRPVWVAHFLTWCKSQGLPVDFVSTHPYPTDFALDEQGTGRGRSRPAGATTADLKLLKAIVSASAYPNAEIHLTEWSTSPSPRDYAHDYPPAATFVMKANLESLHLANSLSYWTFTDVFEEGGAGDTWTHGGFGLIHYQGIVKPTFHAYRFLHSLGEEMLHQSAGIAISRHRADGKITALLYHYPSEFRDAPHSSPTPEEARQTLTTGSQRVFEITLNDLPTGATFELETVDDEHGWAIPAWKAMGSPPFPDRKQTEILREAARNTARQVLSVDAAGTLQVRLTARPWAVLRLRQI